MRTSARPTRSASPPALATPRPITFSQAYCNGAITTAGQSLQGHQCPASTSPSPPSRAPPNLDPTQANGQGLGGQLNSGVRSSLHGSARRRSTTGAREVQQQVTTDLIFTLGYIGTTGTYLHSNLLQINDLNPRYFGYGAALWATATTATPGIAAPYPRALPEPSPRRCGRSRSIKDIYSDGDTGESRPLAATRR